MCRSCGSITTNRSVRMQVRSTGREALGLTGECVSAKQLRVDELQDQIDQIELQAPGKQDEDNMTKLIRPLENRLEKAMIKVQEAGS